jgi:hypothetical protein
MHSPAPSVQMLREQLKLEAMRPRNGDGNGMPD